MKQGAACYSFLLFYKKYSCNYALARMLYEYLLNIFVFLTALINIGNF